MLRGCKSLCTALALATALQLPANAHADTQSVTAGAVTATITWRPTTADRFGGDFKLTITRSGSTAFSGPVTIHGQEGDFAPVPSPIHKRAVAAQDLDGDGEPEIVVDVSTGGAHCCNISKLYRWNGSAYQQFEHRWGNVGYSLKDGLIVGADDFSYEFGSFADSRSPLMILDARLDNVTAMHTDLVEKDAKALKRDWTRNHNRAALAAYVADLYTLGRGSAAKKLLATASKQGKLKKQGRYDLGPFGTAYLKALNKLLRDRGYARS